MRMNMKSQQSGFTMIEVLVTIAILVVGLLGLAAIAIPSLSNMLAAQAVRNASYDLNADLIFARSEAIARATNVSITGASSTNFKAGWTITEAAGGTTLRTQSSRDSRITFTSNANVYTFDKTGRVTVGAPAQWEILPTGGTPQDYQKRCIKLDPSGRPRTSDGVCS